MNILKRLSGSGRVKVRITFKNRAESQITKHIEYKKQWFDKVNFADWHFTASINPQPFRLKLKAKKFTNLKLIIKNEENSACTILNLVLQVDSFGYSK